ncbi:MAG: hypothetical protein ABH842_02365 [Candidatus Micrarchaeota archaeon]
MAVKSDRYSVPDVQDAVPIEIIIDNLRKKIDFDCSILLQQARRINQTKRNFSLKVWESKIVTIREAQRSTFSIEELNKLKGQCQVLSDQLGQFRN